jgi:hyperosmotically inducible protein
MKTLMMNFKWVSCIFMLVLMVGCSGSHTKESTGEYVDDAAITTKIKSELAASEQTSALAIEVETFKGEVQLSGFVNTATEKSAAARIARGVKGVTDVHNNLIVK